jgi:hypothetical protein
VYEIAHVKNPLAWWEYAVFGTMALGIGVAFAMAPMVPWG